LIWLILEFFAVSFNNDIQIKMLISDQSRLGFWVPRVRWSSKVVRDESPKGSDVIGFQFHKEDGKMSPQRIFLQYSKPRPNFPDQEKTDYKMRSMINKFF
jgi:hypothetical protein